MFQYNIESFSEMIYKIEIYTSFLKYFKKKVLNVNGGIDIYKVADESIQNMNTHQLNILLLSLDLFKEIFANQFIFLKYLVGSVKNEGLADSRILTELNTIFSKITNEELKEIISYLSLKYYYSSDVFLIDLFQLEKIQNKKFTYKTLHKYLSDFALFLKIYINNNLLKDENFDTPLLEKTKWFLDILSEIIDNEILLNLLLKNIFVFQQNISETEKYNEFRYEVQEFLNKIPSDFRYLIVLKNFPDLLFIDRKFSPFNSFFNNTFLDFQLVTNKNIKDGKMLYEILKIQINLFIRNLYHRSKLNKLIYKFYIKY